jgi:hypothetical protein
VVAAPALGLEQGGQGINGGPGIGVWIETPAAAGAETAPVADQQGAAEQVGRSWLKVPSGEAGGNSQRRGDFQAVEAPFIAFGADANEGGGFREERKLDRRRACGAGFAAFGHDLPGSVSPPACEYQRKARRGRGVGGHSDTLLTIVYQTVWGGAELGRLKG